MATCIYCKKTESVEGKKSCQPCLDTKKEQTRARNARLKAAGICRCGKNPIVEGTTCCEPCRVRRIKYTQDRANKMRAKALCPCGRDKPVEGKKLCKACGEKAKSQSDKRYKENRESGKCTQCGTCEKVNNKSRCEKCLKIHRRNNRKYRYGIRQDDVDRMMQEQNGKCRICETDITDLEKGYHVDHCHETNKVRGLLCHGCNTFLGKYETRRRNLEKINKYLETQ